MFLSLEDSLGTLLAYEEDEDKGEDEEKKGGKGEINEEVNGEDVDNIENSAAVSTVFLFGLIDHDMLTCCKLPMTLTCGKYKIHFARLLYYNIHGVLFTLAWCGMDSTLGTG